MNVAQFKINERFTLSLSDLGKDNGFEPMLIDNQNKGEFDKFIDLTGVAWRVSSVDTLQNVIKEAKKKANRIIKKELIKENKDLFIK